MFGASLIGLVPTAACVSSGVFLWMKEVVRSGRELEWESERKRGEVATVNLIPESVEWLNTLLGVFWGLINPDMFQGVADTLEDVMQASVPGIIGEDSYRERGRKHAVMLTEYRKCQGGRY